MTNTTTKKSNTLLKICLLLIFLLALFFLFIKPVSTPDGLLLKSRFSKGASYNEAQSNSPYKIWVGSFDQQMLGPGGDVKGTIDFELNELGELIGHTKSIYVTGDETTFDLRDITGSEDGKMISGRWVLPARKLKGNFRFTLDADGKSFKGFFSENENERPSARYYWNGTRK